MDLYVWYICCPTQPTSMCNHINTRAFFSAVTFTVQNHCEQKSSELKTTTAKNWGSNSTFEFLNFSTFIKWNAMNKNKKTWLMFHDCLPNKVRMREKIRVLKKFVSFDMNLWILLEISIQGNQNESFCLIKWLNGSEPATMKAVRFNFMSSERY